MVLISLVFLFVCIFGAFSYGWATLLSLRYETSVWGMHNHYSPAVRRSIDRVSIALFAISTVWFVLHALLEFQSLTTGGGGGWLQLVAFIAYLFPPVIMHTMYLEATCEDGASRQPYWLMVAGMYVLSPALGLYLLLAVLDVAPGPQPLGAWVGGSIGGMFTLSSLFSTVIMTRRHRQPMTPDQSKLRNVMLFLFVSLSLTFIALMLMREARLLVAILDRITRSAPIFFMIASIYFEDRFAFYDHILKRGLLLLLAVVVLALALAVTLPWLDALPAGAARPWLYAVALVPVAMVMPWLSSRAERWLDRMWLGREFTPVAAVTHLLTAMQPATDEDTLIQATETKLRDIFGAKIEVLVGSRAVLESAVDTEVKLTSPVTGAIVRLAVIKAAGTRRIFSEDLALLRTLGSVFGFMLENTRLQRKRVEQEQVAQELRLQSSRSELKALRAQINPHFLFNALNAIASLIHTDPARADEAVEQLAEVFRYTLRRSDSEWAPLDQELTFARAYLDVEQARFGQRLTCTIDSDHLPPAPHVPSMLLQTLLENAVKHGVSQERGPGRIDVVVRTTSGEVVIEVRNTGPDPLAHGGSGAGRSSTAGEGFGLHSVRERLKGHFGDRAVFSLTRDEAQHMTVAKLVMPHVRITA